jgi:hypothetical protein
MFILLNWKCLEPALPDVPARVIVTRVPTNMGREQPVHPAAQIAITAWPQNQVKVIGHETVPEQSHRTPQRCLRHHLKERAEIVGLVEDRGPSVTPVEHVVTISGR